MGIDFETLIILAVLAFILFGPEKLPEIAAKLGYYMGKMREASAELSKEYQASFNNPVQTPPARPAAGETAPEPALPHQAGVYEKPCPMCTHLVSKDFSFCPRCGHRLKPEEPGLQIPPQSLAS